MEIKSITTKDELPQLYPVLSQLYPKLSEPDFIKYVEEMWEQNYHLLASFEEDVPVAIIGYRLGRRLYCGKYLHIDNLIVDEKHRNKDLATKLVAYVKNLAKELGCNAVLADSYVMNTKAHKFFHKNGFFIRGYHLKLDIDNSK
jgi:GNAT superfamily N-acetyltransferase